MVVARRIVIGVRRGGAAADVARIIVLMTACGLMAACAVAPRPEPGGAPAGGRTAAAAAPDPAQDLRQLITAPFAGTLQDLPFAVHEVLQFGDAARTAASGRGAEECFRRDAAAPRFLGRDLEDYLLCFRGDRLVRIEAELRLETDGVEAAFDRYCDGWLKNTTRSARSGANCRGQAGGVSFEARLDEDRSQTTTSMSVVLTQDPDDVP